MISYFIGLSPFSVEGPKGRRRLVKTLFGFINPFIQMTFFTVSFVIVFYRNESILHYFFKTNVSIIADLTLKVVWFLGLPIVFYSSLSRSNELAKLFKIVTVIDQGFKHQGLTFDYKSAMRKTYSWGTVAAFSNILFIAYSLWILLKNGIYPSFPAFVAYFQPNGYLFHVVILFSGVCCRMSKRIDATNLVS